MNETSSLGLIITLFGKIFAVSLYNERNSGTLGAVTVFIFSGFYLLYRLIDALFLPSCSWISIDSWKNDFQKIFKLSDVEMSKATKKEIKKIETLLSRYEKHMSPDEWKKEEVRLLDDAFPEELSKHFNLNRYPESVLSKFLLALIRKQVR